MAERQEKKLHPADDSLVRLRKPVIAPQRHEHLAQ
jgi:hypothetical protein